MTEQSDLKSTLRSDLQDAIRAQDKVRSATLRMVLTAVSNEEVSGKEARVLSDEDVLKVVAKEAKKRREAAEAYTGAGRDELADVELAELAVLEGYLPRQLDDAALDELAAAAVAESGASGMAQMGQVMKLAQAEAAGRADGGALAAKVKARLAG